MDGLEEGRGALSHGGRGQHAQGAGDGRGFVGENVAKDVAREQHVKLRGIAHKLHGRIVHVHVREFHFGVVLVHGGDDFPPQARGFEHIALVDGADPLLALHGRFKGHDGNAADLFFGIEHGVEACPLAVAHFNTPGLAKVDVAGQFADHDEIQALLGRGRLEQAGAGKFGQEQGRTQVGKEPEFLADAQDALFGTLVRGKSVPLGAAHGAQEDGIAGLAGINGFPGQGGAGGVIGGAADEGFGKDKLGSGTPGNGFQSLAALGYDFSAYAVAGKKADGFAHADFRRFLCGTKRRSDASDA